ncbi:MAG TPA: MlaD family protein [Verrucomicrobiae bacterium]|nr:MlaD family protein [Verrucomicrobiae bacterium]
MNSKREQVWVGLFVLVAVALLIVVVVSVSGAFATKGVEHRAYFKYAAGLMPGVPVRYGGLLVGRLEHLRVDPQDSTRIEILFSVSPDTPVKTDSLAKISALGALGESYLEITTGTRGAALAPPGSTVPSKELLAVTDIGDMVAGVVPTAQEVLQNLNNRLTEMKTTLANVNDLLGEPNRKNIAASLTNVNGMLAENRPQLKATLDNVHDATQKLSPILKNVQTASDKISPMLDDLKGTIKQANDTLAKVDSIMTENQPEIKATLADLRKVLGTANEMTEILKKTLDRNTDNLDEILVNIRETTDNMQQMTDALKRNPSLLIRGETGKDRKPGTTN